MARVASHQHGVVTVRQLLEVGLTRHAVARRVEKGLLHPVHRGVYRVGHQAPSTEARYLAAVLACGAGAVLSGRAAAFLYQLIKGTPPPPEVTTRPARRIPSVKTHRVRQRTRQEVASYRAIPVTTVPRTIVDLAAVLSLDPLGRACHEAEVRHRVTAAAVDTILARRPNAPGAAKLHEIFHGEVRVTLSKRWNASS